MKLMFFSSFLLAILVVALGVALAKTGSDLENARKETRALEGNVHTYTIAGMEILGMSVENSAEAREVAEALTAKFAKLEKDAAEKSDLAMRLDNAKPLLAFKQALGQFALTWVALAAGPDLWNHPAYVSIWKAMQEGNSEFDFSYYPNRGDGELIIPLEDTKIHYAFSLLTRDFTIKVVDSEGKTVDEVSSKDFEKYASPSE